MTNWLTENSLFKPAPKVIWEEVNGELVLYKLNTGNYFRLNSSGTAVWKYMLKKLNGLEIAQRMRDTYKQTGEAVDRETNEFLTSLIEEGLVQVGK